MSDTRYQILLDGKVRPTMESWPSYLDAEISRCKMVLADHSLAGRLTVAQRGPITVDAGPSDGSLVGKVEEND